MTKQFQPANWAIQRESRFLPPALQRVKTQRKNYPRTQTSRKVELKVQGEQRKYHRANEMLNLLQVGRKAPLIRGIESILPKFIDKAIAIVISRNAPRIDQMPVDELRKMKAELEKEKPVAIETGIRALERSPDWLSCDQHGMTLRRAFDESGVSQFGPIWKTFQNFSRSLENVFTRYGLKVGDSFNPMILHLQAVLIPNRAVGDAHANYCRAKYRCDSLEDALKEAKAREKFESA